MIIKKVSIIILILLVSLNIVAIPKKADNIVIFKILPSFKLESSQKQYIKTSLEGILTNLGYGIISDKIQDEALKEQKNQQQSDCYDDECLVNTGKMLAAKKILIVKIDKRNNNYFIKLRKIDIETAILEGSSATLYKFPLSDFDNLDSTLSRLSKKVFIAKEITNLSIKSDNNNFSNLYIDSNPRKAIVEINGEYRGVTPINLKFKNGQYHIVLKKESYQDYQLDKDISRNSSINISLKSKKYFTTIKTTPSGADVYSCHKGASDLIYKFNSNKIGTTPYKAELINSSKCFYFYKYGYETIEHNIKYEGSEAVSYRLKSKKKFKIKFLMDKKYKIEYQDLDDPTKKILKGHKKMKLPEGKYNFIFSKKDFQKRTEIIEISKKSKRKFNIKLEKELNYLTSVEGVFEHITILGVGDTFSIPVVGITATLFTFSNKKLSMDIFKFGFLNSISEDTPIFRFSVFNMEFINKNFFFATNLSSFLGEMDVIFKKGKDNIWYPLGIKTGLRYVIDNKININLYTKLDWAKSGSTNGVALSLGVSFEYKLVKIE